MSIDVNVQNDLVIVTETTEDIVVNVSNAAGPQGPAGAAGVGVPVGGTTGQVLKKFTNSNYDTYWAADASGLTSVGLSVPTGLTVTNSPLTSNGTIAVGLESGYSIPTTASQATWNTAYNDSIVSAAVTGTTTKTLTLNQQDGGSVTASWTDINTDAVTSVFGRTGAVVSTEGDYTLTQLGDVTLTSPTNGQVLKYNGTTWVNNTDTDTGLTSVGLSMPSAFAVSNSPLTSNGTLAVTGAGTADQYVRGDGQLANFPTNGGGGSSVNYYLNGSVSQGTFGGDTYYEMSKTPIIGAGTNFTRTNAQGNGYIASFITDAGDPALLSIPGGNWNVEFYFNASSGGSNPSFYAELYKVSSSNVFTLIGSGSTNPEGITNGTAVDQYFTSIPVPQTALLTTDRIAIRIFVTPSGRNITLHTEDNNLCEVLTTFSTGLNALNGLTAQVQYFATGTSGTDFAISSVTDTHTFNLPIASGTNTGKLSNTDWTTFNNKVGGSGVAGQVAYWNGTSSQTGSNNLFWDAANARLGIGTNAPAYKLDVNGTARVSDTFTAGTNTFTNKLNAQFGTIGIQSYAVNNAWFGDNVYFNGGFYRIANGYSGLFYFAGNEGQFRWGTTSTAGTQITNGASGAGIISFKMNLDGSIAMGDLSATAGDYTGAGFLFFGATKNIGINTTTDAGYKLDVNGTARYSGRITSTVTNDSALVLQSTGFLTFDPGGGNIMSSSAPSLIGGSTTGLAIRFATGIVMGTGSAGYHYMSVDNALFSAGLGAVNLASLKNASAVLQADSTTRGFLPPRMTTTQRDAIASPATGLQIYNTTTNANNYYDGTAWVSQQSVITNPVTGTGTTNYLPKWTSGSAIGNSIVQDNGSSVGIGVSSFIGGYKLEVSGLQRNYGANNDLRFGELDANYNFFQGVNQAGTVSKGFIFFGTGEYMRITPSSNLLVGGTTDNGNRLQVTGDGYFSGNVGIGTATALGKLHVVGNGIFDDGVNGRITIENASGQNDIYSTTTGFASYKDLRYSAAGHIFRNGTTETMRLTPSGILGLGVQPSAWTDFKVLQNVGGSLIGEVGQLDLWQNAYYDGAIKYYANGTATRYSMSFGTHRWFTAASGTANGTISFTTGMTLSASSNLLVGTTTDSGEKLQVSGTSLITGAATFSSSVTATSFIKSGGTSSQYLMADGSVTTGGGGSVDELQVSLICQVFG
jgi:hypothetical protein